VRALSAIYQPFLAKNSSYPPFIGQKSSYPPLCSTKRQSVKRVYLELSGGKISVILL
jgi:hypothetical protein